MYSLPSDKDGDGSTVQATQLLVMHHTHVVDDEGGQGPQLLATKQVEASLAGGPPWPHSCHVTAEGLSGQ